MRSGGARRHDGWGLRLALVLVALGLRILIPPGVMPGTPSDGGVPLVICTGHGPAVSLGGDKSPGHPDKPPPPCAFAGHVLGPAPAGPDVIASHATAYAAAVFASASDLAPGRGLAAPPPPSTGPPVLL